MPLLLGTAGATCCVPEPSPRTVQSGMPGGSAVPEYTVIVAVAVTPCTLAVKVTSPGKTAVTVPDPSVARLATVLLVRDHVASGRGRP
jgi:hypothetical protein